MQNVLVTGGAGFLGRGILRRVQQGSLDWKVTVFSRDETKQDECRQRYPDARYILGDITDRERLFSAMVGHDIVIHAAAMKYVPDAERNALECVRVNVSGAENVIAAAIRANVGRVVGISTDKAVEPINVYGMTKAIMERMFGEVARFGPTVFTTVRYGNVVGSTGSVIPLFQKQLREHGRVSVTDPRMTRFWMSINDAVDCVVFALDERRVPGSVTVPRPKAMQIGKLAEVIAGECGIDVVGPRAGEKDHERLVHFQESLRVRQHEGYYELVPVTYPLSERVKEAMTVSSQYPPAGWVTPSEMLGMIQEAADV